MSAPPRLVFLGSDAIALPLLDWLRGAGGALAEVVAVFTQPDRPAGRGQRTEPNAIKTWALAGGLPVHQPAKLGDADLSALAATGADAGLVLAYGHILSEAFLSTPRLGMLNLHASLLPSYRGASPIQSAVARGERETGMSLMRIVRELDAGPVADVERVPIGPRDTAADVERRLASACVPLLARTLPRLASGGLAFVPQDASRATVCRRLRKEDGAVDFGAPAAAVAARINGLFPWPGVSVTVAGQAVRLGRAEPAEGAAGAEPGRVLGADPDGLVVAAGQGAVRLLELQRPGGRMLPAPEFLRGFPVPAGTQLPSAPAGDWVRPLR